MVSLPSCPTCTNRADELRPKINKEREMAKRRVGWREMAKRRVG
jgi:hypothetical protein